MKRFRVDAWCLLSACLAACALLDLAHAEVIGWVGSQVCLSCHLDSHRDWSRSVHARHMAAPTPEHVRGDFTRENEHRYEGTRSRMFIEGDRYFMEHVNARGDSGVYEIHQALGQARHQVYLHRRADGRLQVLPAYWNITEGRWRHSIEGPINDRGALEPTHPMYWGNFGQTYNHGCIECHSSQPQRRFDLEANRYDSQFDPQINCESCHGPGDAHVARWRRLEDVEGPDETLAPVERGGAEARVEICAACHASKRAYQEGYHPGAPFYDYFAPDVWAPGRVHVDGRSATLNYHFIDYTQSACFRRSEQPMGCAGGCHPPHDLVSTRGATVEEANAICTRCHVEHKIRLVEHTFHKAESEGSRCVACHMPKLDLDMDMFSTDHTIGSPLPELTRRFGAPNACNDCHKHDTPEWAEGHVSNWFGETAHFRGYRARMVERAEVLHAAFEEQRLDAPVLAAWLADPGKDLITRASAAHLLRHARGAVARAALIEASRDPHPLIRYYAVGALKRAHAPEARAALLAALEDPRRVVRVQAYEALRWAAPAIEADPRAAGVHQEWLTREALRADEPRFKSEEALRRFSRGDVAGAEALLRHAARVGGAVPRFRLDYIHLLLRLHRVDEAEAQARRVAQAHPGSTHARLARALVALGRGRAAEALVLLEGLRAEGVEGPAVLQGIAAARARLAR